MRSIEQANFVVGIGAQKAGTTWLYDYLAGHPDFCMTRRKELHYFDVRYRADLSYDEYEKPMLRAIKDLYRMRADMFFRLCMSADERCYQEYFTHIYQGQRAFGEMTPAYAMLDAEVFARIAGMHPRTKFIFLMRNPADRLWAQIRFYEQIYGQDIDTLCEQIALPLFRLKSDYPRTIRELYACVKPEDVCLMFYEELFCEASVRRICAFCDIEFRPGAYSRYSNKGYVERSLEMERRRAFITSLYDVYAGINELFQGQIPESWKRDMDSVSGPVCSSIPQTQPENMTQNTDKIFQCKLAENTYPEKFRKIFNTDQSNPLFHYYLGRLKLQIGDHAAAERCLESAIGLDGNVPYFYFMQRKILKQRGKPIAAIQHYLLGILKFIMRPGYPLDCLASFLHRKGPRFLRGVIACSKIQEIVK